MEVSETQLLDKLSAECEPIRQVLAYFEVLSYRSQLHVSVTTAENSTSTLELKTFLTLILMLSRSHFQRVSGSHVRDVRGLKNLDKFMSNDH